MEFETAGMQRALAKWNHDHECVFLYLVEVGNHDMDDCPLAKQWLSKAGWMIAAMVPAITQDVVIPTRKHMRKKIAGDIEADLVCCDLYDRINEATPESLGVSEQEWAAMSGQQVADKLELSYHAICHWAGYSADIARKGLSYRREEEDGTQAWAAEAP